MAKDFRAKPTEEVTKSFTEVKGVEDFLDKVPETSVVGYSQESRPTDPESVSAVMKVVTLKKDDVEVNQYYVKVNGSRVFDPLDIGLDPQMKLGAKNGGVYVWRYKRVSGEAFGMYKDFLLRKNARLKHAAEKMILDGKFS